MSHACTSATAPDMDAQHQAVQPANRCAVRYVCSNADKHSEARLVCAALGIDIAHVESREDDHEIQGSVEDIARHKCLVACSQSDMRQPVLVEDVALCFDALGGMPGPYVRDFMRANSLRSTYALPGIAGLPGVTAVSALAYSVDGREVHLFVGRARGLVRDPTVHAHLPAWYPLVSRDPTDVGLAGDEASAVVDPSGVTPCLHRVRSFVALARFLDTHPPTCVHVASPAVPAAPMPTGSASEADGGGANCGDKGDADDDDDRARMVEAVRVLIKGVGEDPARDGLRETPSRVAKALMELTAGYRLTLADAIGDALFDHADGNMVVVRSIEFFSLCEHHMLPFMGRVHVGYMPTGKIIGLSKVPRVVNMYARRLQVQERLTSEIAHCIMAATGAAGVGVVAEATHMCMCMRGVNKTGSTTLTTTFLGTVESDPQTRTHFMALARPAHT